MRRYKDFDVGSITTLSISEDLNVFRCFVGGISLAKNGSDFPEDVAGGAHGSRFAGRS